LGLLTAFLVCALRSFCGRIPVDVVLCLGVEEMREHAADFFLFLNFFSSMSEVKVNALTRGKYPSRRGEGANGIIFKRILMDELMSGVNLFRPEEEVRGEE
jgi:hypothetical protein